MMYFHSSASVAPVIFFSIHLTLDFTLSMNDALCTGVAGVGLAVPTGSLWFTPVTLVANVASLTGTAPEGALVMHTVLRH